MATYEFSINVRPKYLEAHSNPDEHHFVFAYTVTIRNTGEHREVGVAYGSSPDDTTRWKRPR
jgi:uncharacterized protein affecting Mg2+/Co2+ transport